MKPLTWIPVGAAFKATHRRGVVLVTPSGRTPGHWAARDVAGIPLRPLGTTEPEDPSWPTIEDAKAACVASLAPRKAGRKSTGVQRYVLHLHPDEIAIVDADAGAQGLTRAQFVQALLVEYRKRKKS